jgi:4-carboxymuconolactone decarboxylase
MKARLITTLALALTASSGHAADRFPVLKSDQLTPAQMKFAKDLLAGPRGAADASFEAGLERILVRGPFNAWMRSPELGDRLQKVGEFVRFKTSLDLRLNEMAILITARYWSSQYEWFAHEILARKAGLDPKIIMAIADNKRPKDMKADEAAVYDFATQLHRTKKVTDAAYKRAVELFGEQGVMDLVGVVGYYTAVSMTLNVAEVPVPAGQKNPLK